MIKSTFLHDLPWLIFGSTHPFMFRVLQAERRPRLGQRQSTLAAQTTATTDVSSSAAPPVLRFMNHSVARTRPWTNLQECLWLIYFHSRTQTLTCLLWWNQLTAWLALLFFHVLLSSQVQDNEPLTKSGTTWCFTYCRVKTRGPFFTQAQVLNCNSAAFVLVYWGLSLTWKLLMKEQTLVFTVESCSFHFTSAFLFNLHNLLWIKVKITQKPSWKD